MAFQTETGLIDDGLKDEPEQKKNINKKQNRKRIEQAKKNDATKNSQQTK